LNPEIISMAVSAKRDRFERWALNLVAFLAVASAVFGVATLSTTGPMAIYVASGLGALFSGGTYLRLSRGRDAEAESHGPST
jgi:hypothetical protein